MRGSSKNKIDDTAYSRALEATFPETARCTEAGPAQHKDTLGENPEHPATPDISTAVNKSSLPGSGTPTAEPAPKPGQRYAVREKLGSGGIAHIYADHFKLSFLIENIDF